MLTRANLQEIKRKEKQVDNDAWPGKYIFHHDHRISIVLLGNNSLREKEQRFHG